MTSSKHLILSDPQADTSARALEEAYLYWVRYYFNHSGRRQPRYRFWPKTRKGLWKNLDRGAVSCLTLFPSTAKSHKMWEEWAGHVAVSISDAIMSDWHAVGKDLYSALVKDRIKTHNCGQYSFSFEPESEPESTVTTSR